MEVEVRKSKGIDTLVSGYSPQKVEEEKRTSTEGNSKLADLMRRFEDFLHEWYPHRPESILPKEVLLPATLSVFSSMITKYENNPFYENDSGRFLNSLIQNSYDAGYNNFQLETRNNLLGLGTHLQGDSHRPLLLELTGKTECTGCRIDYCRVTCHGPASLNAVGTEHSTFIFFDPVIYLGGDFFHCTFKTPDQRLLQRIESHFSRNHSGRGNRFILIHGEEEYC